MELEGGGMQKRGPAFESFGNQRMKNPDP